MDVNDLKGLFAEVNKRMNAALEHVRHELAGVRTGRASVTILDSVHVEAYGSRMPLNQLAGLSVPEPTLIVAQPFDPSQLGAIEKAIRASDLGLNPANDGKVVRIPIPSLTEERRKELSRHVHKLTEEGRNSVRQVRRDANERLKKLLKDHKISEDDEKKGLDEVQKITDNHVKQIDELQKKKDAGAAGQVESSQIDQMLAVCMSFFTHLECSVPCGAPLLDPRERHHLCRCGAPLLARYDLDAARSWRRETLAGRAADDVAVPRADADLRRRDSRSRSAKASRRSSTPRRSARRSASSGSTSRTSRSTRPTRSRRAASRRRSRARSTSGATTIALPSAGNAGNAAAAYAAAARACVRRCSCPNDVKPPFVDECRLYGADVTLVDGLITDAGRMAAERGAPLGWYDVSTLKEPYRIEGKKTMAYELAEQMDWRWPDWIVYPTGGGTGMVGMWKAFDEIEAIGWMPRGRRPRMVSVQAEGCAPIVRAFESGTEKAAAWENAATVADGLRVPRAIGDFLILRAVRESGGTALAVSDQVDDRRACWSWGAPKGSAPRRKAARRSPPCGGWSLTARIQPIESVVLFNTGGALKYLDVLRN